MRGLFVDSPLKTMAKSAPAAALFLTLILSSCAAPATAPLPYAGPVAAGTLAEPRNRESSGLAPSHRTPDLLWTHADSGGEPLLYGVAAGSGELRGKIRITGAANTDWEDLASFGMDGKAWLVVGDVGDNQARRPFVILHIVPEPDAVPPAPDAELEIAPAYTLRVVYEDGARDCESLAVDAREGAIYLLSKREPVPRLYRVPLAPSADPVTARFVGPVPHLPRPDALQRLLKTPTGAYRGNPCAMDFAPDGTAALVLTYGDTLLFPRAAGETWADALAKHPVVLAPHGLPQAEAACFSADDRVIFVTSEKSMPFLRYDHPR